MKEKKVQSPGEKYLEEMKELDGLIKSLKQQIRHESNMLTDTAVHYKDIQVQSGGVKDIIGEKVPELTELKEQFTAYVKELSGKKVKALSIIKTMRTRRQRVIITYFMQNNTIEKTAEKMNKSYTWTWNEIQAAVLEFDKLFQKYEKSV